MSTAEVERQSADVDNQDRRVWIDPEISVPPTADDYFSGRDAALEAALAAPLCGPDS